ncbi:MAG: DNA polymerase II large subunit [Candidatus Diapherotrites archaeon]
MSFDLKIDAPIHVVNYYKKLTKQVNEQLAIAKKARAKGKDVSLEVETTPTTDLADRCEKITGPPGIAERYRKIYKEMDGDRTKTIFKIFKEIIENNPWVNIPDREKRLEQAVKTSLVLVTEGVVVAPLDGVPSVKISKNFDGSEFVDIYFAGPIRAAGGTATVFPLILGDYARKLMGLERYKPTEEEIERYVEETNIYDDIFTRQYKLHPEEVRKIIRGCPVCINGEPTEEREVTAFKDLERIPSNRVRGGMCLVICEGVALKAMKILTFANMLKLDWKWLEGIIKVSKSGDKDKTIKENFSYLTRIAAGRPIFSYPMKPGGFRLRYGRSRNTGIMGKAIHPATMYVLDEFIAVGTQMKVERPGKSAEIFPCDSIEGPIVKLLSGEVRKITSIKEAQEIKNQLKEIIFLGDLLISYGDFRKSAHPLMPVGYCVEWWVLELEKALNKGRQIEGIDTDEILKNPEAIDGFTAAELSLQLKIPLHPEFTHYYSLLKHKDVVELVGAVRKGNKIFDENRIIALKMEHSEDLKDLLETIGLPHKIIEGKIVIGKNLAYSFVKTFGGLSLGKVPEEGSVLEILSKLSGMEIRDKCGTFIGTRMGRPEAARPRKMVGNPHVLFPIGIYGGSTRSINKASETSELRGGRRGEIEVEMAFYKCPDCGKTVPLANCPECGARATKVYLCGRCGNLSETKKCSKCSADADAFSKRKVNIDELLLKAITSLKVKMPETLKGVKGLINESKIAEPLEKGILRANRNLNIFRDATIRFEMLNAPLTHFKPREIGTSPAKMKELGYEKDVDGKPLENDEQLLEIFPQDIIINEDSVEFFIRVTKFVDDLLVKFYGLEPYYKKGSTQDMVGELVMGLAPHTSAAIVGRIIGFSKARLCFAHPFFHLTKRRNCLTGKTPVLIENANHTKIVPIDSFDDGTEREVIPLQNILTYTVDENGLIKKEKVKALLKQMSPKTMFAIRTMFGREITATGNHELLVFDGKRIAKRPVSKLQEGDSLLSLSKFSSVNKLKQINVLEWFIQNYSRRKKAKLRVHNVKPNIKKLVKKYGGCWKLAKKTGYRKYLNNNYKQGKSIHTAIDFDSVPLDLFEIMMKELGKEAGHFKDATIGYNKQKSTLPITIPLNKEFAEIIGYFLADGYARTTDNKKREKYVYQINFVSAEREISKKISRNIAELFNRKLSSSKRKNLDYITLSGRIYYELFTKILKTGSNAKNKHVPAVFFNTDKKCQGALVGSYAVGDGYIDSNSIKIVSVNKNLINEVGLVCSMLGCFPHLFHEKRTINTGIVKEFYEKKGKIKTLESWGIRLYSEDLLTIGKFLFGRRGKRFARIKKSKVFRSKRVKKIGSFALDKIKEIKKAHSKEKFVYDLMVEGNKTYIGGFGNLAIYDCDGDQDSVMLLMDGLLNFSQHYLPSTRGGRMDAPLVFTVALKPTEIDDEAYEIETCKRYPLELYEKCSELIPPDLDSIPRVFNKLGTKEQYTGINFTHPTSTFDGGPKVSRYVQLDSMESKINAQAKLQGKIRAVEKKDALERVMVSHFLPDIIGNARAFSRQTFRCTRCNTKYRRIPLSGKCWKCGDSGNIILTIAQGSVRKYLKIANEMILKYGLSDYIKQRIKLIEQEVDSVFQNDKMEQKNLFQFV